LYRSDAGILTRERILTGKFRLQTEGFWGQLRTYRGSRLAGMPADFGKFIAAETEKWGRVVRQERVKAD
jgi:hypothetical protein